MTAGAAAPDQDPGAATPAAPSAPQPAGAATHPPDSPATPAEPAARQTILVVEDEPALLRALRINLRARGYEALTMQAGRPALDHATQRKPDAVILDLGLPDIDGIDLIRELRAVTSAPVIVLSGRTGPGDKIGALDAGADDYVTKPFSMEELLARLRAALRRDGPAQPIQPVAIGRSTIDLAAHLATRDGEQVRLTPTEWRLLEILIRHPGQLVGGRRLLTEVWGPAYQQSTHYLRFHMAGLRRKLEDDPARPQHLLTEPGMGYRFSP
jgi:two-component system, OmpR family, KDP operon response regulator KdpE